MAVNTEFFLKEAWLSMRRGGLMSLAAFVIVFISLVMLGIFLLILFNLNMLMGSLGDKMEIMAYTDINFTRAGAENLKNQITQINGVARVEFIPKENAWAAFKEDFSNINLGNMLDTNPLPDAFKVKTEKIEMIPHISQTIQALSGIEDVRYGGETAKRIKIFSIVVRWIGFGIISVMIIATLLIVVNTIRLTVLARKDDIYIMRLVGATSSFVRWPFILEGVLIGTLGAFFAALVLKISYEVLAQNLQTILPFLPISFDALEINLIYLFVFIFGLFLGFIGATISVAQSLKLTQT